MGDDTLDVASPLAAAALAASDDPESAPAPEPGTAPPLPTQRVYYVAGLPRSGSTLLLALLAQNPQHRVTPTSGLVDLVLNVRNGWTHNPNFQAEGIQKAAPRIGSAIRGLIDGYHAGDLAGDRIVFNKNRGWPHAIDVLDAAYGAPQKVILCIRDVRAVIASFEKLYRANPLTRHGFPPDAPMAMTAEGRARILLAPGGVVGASINHIRDAIARGPRDRLLFVHYRLLTNRPRDMLAAVHATLGLPMFDGYKPDNVEPASAGDATIHGWGPSLHDVRGYVEPGSGVPWEGIYTDAFMREVAEAYADVSSLGLPRGG